MKNRKPQAARNKVSSQANGGTTMKNLTSKSLSIVAFTAIALLFGACSQPADLVPVVTESVAQAPAEQTPAITDADQTDAVNEEATGLQASGIPCIKYKVKQYNFVWEAIYQAGYADGEIVVIKSPSCKGPIKVSLEGQYAYPRHSPLGEAGKITGQFDEVATIHIGNTYRTHFDPMAGTYKVALRVTAGNISKAIAIITLI